MNPTLQQELILAIRAGDLSAAKAALAAGADSNGVDENGVPGLPLRIAAFNGQYDIVRELVAQGADIHPDQTNPLADNPIKLAVRGNQKETVRLLIELGAEVPSGLQTGLTLLETLAAQGIANRAGRDRKAAAGAQRGAPPPILESRAEEAAATRAALPAWMARAAGEIEQIDLQGCVGVDTNALNDDVLRLASSQADATEAEKPIDHPALDVGGKFRFWKKKS